MSLPACPWRRAAAAALLLAVTGCAAPVQIRPLATARSDLQAFELRGSELPALQREVLRLCPGGADVLRQAQAGQAFKPTEPELWRRWMQQAGDWLDPPPRQAQLMVVCLDAPAAEPAAVMAAAASGRPTASAVPASGVAATVAISPPAVPAAAATLPSAPAVTAAAQAAAARAAPAPIGPLMIEW